MPILMIPLSESAQHALDELVRTSGLSVEAILERALDNYRRQLGLQPDPRFQPQLDAGNRPQNDPSAASRVAKTPGICGGRACIRGTRIPVWGLVAYRQLGMSDEGILRAVQGLKTEDLQAAWDYAAANHEEIGRDIRENEEGEAGLVG